MVIVSEKPSNFSQLILSNTVKCKNAFKSQPEFISLQFYSHIFVWVSRKKVRERGTGIMKIYGILELHRAQKKYQIIALKNDLFHTMFTSINEFPTESSFYFREIHSTKCHRDSILIFFSILYSLLLSRRQFINRRGKFL